MTAIIALENNYIAHTHSIWNNEKLPEEYLNLDDVPTGVFRGGAFGDAPPSYEPSTFLQAQFDMKRTKKKYLP